MQCRTLFYQPSWTKACALLPKSIGQSGAPALSVGIRSGYLSFEASPKVRCVRDSCVLRSATHIHLTRFDSNLVESFPQPPPCNDILRSRDWIAGSPEIPCMGRQSLCAAV